jgi:hypothetical protein
MPNFEYSSKKAGALSAQPRKPRPSLDILPVKLPLEAVQVESAVAIKV